MYGCERKAFASVWFLCAALVLIAPVAVFSQQRNNDPTQSPTLSFQIENVKAEISGLILSSEIKDRAWGAYLIGKYGLSEFIPALRGLLNSVAYGEQIETGFLHNTALDSLIQLQATVPGEEMMPFYQQFPDEVIILLAKSPGENKEAILSLLQGLRSGIRWMAVCNLLTEVKAPGFAAILLRDVKINVSIAVSDDGNVGYGMGSGLGGGIGCGVYQGLDGFPPVVIYKLVDSASRGAVVIAPGKRPVYYLRWAGRPGVSGQGPPFSRGDQGGDEDRKRIEYLAALLDTNKEGLNFDTKYFYSIAWEGPEHFKHEVARVSKEVRESYQRLVERLMEKNLLFEWEAEELKPEITLQVQDFREDQTTGLPDVDISIEH